MKFILTIFFILSTFAIAKSDHYTIVVATTKNIENANHFIQKHNLLTLKENIYTFEQKSNIMTTLGSFSSYNDAKKFQESLPANLLVEKPFIIKTKNSLEIFQPILQKSHYTVAVCNTKNLKNAHSFIKNNIPNQKANIFVFKNKKFYTTTYGAFNTKKEAIEFKNSLSKNLLKHHPYIINSKINLRTKNIQDNLVEIIPFEKQQIKTYISNEPTVLESNISQQIEKKQIILKEKSDPKAILHPSDANIVLIPEKENKLPKAKVDDTFVNLELEYFNLNPSGNIKFQNSQLDINDDIDISSTNSVKAGIDVAINNHRIKSSYYQVDKKSQKTLLENKIIYNNLYRVGDTLNTSFQQSLISLGYGYILNDFYLGLNLNQFQYNFKYDSDTNNLEIKNSLVFPSLSLEASHHKDQFLVSYGGQYGEKNDQEFYDYYIACGLYLKNFFDTTWKIGYKESNIIDQSDKYDLKLHNDFKYFSVEKHF